MKNADRSELVVTGAGIISAIGQGKADFSSALFSAQHNFGLLQRSGRQGKSTFIGAEIPSLACPSSISKRILRTASFSAQAAMLTLHEAWEDARLAEVDPTRIGLIVGGSNFQQRELVNTYENYREREQFIRPTYSLSFMDTDICGLCTEHFGIRGLAYTVGGASASGQLAVIQAMQAVQSGQVDVCIALGALMDLSHWECQALRSFGAMGSDRYGDEPALACRPFDQQRDGFIFGESCGAVVIEKRDAAVNRDLKCYAMLSGSAVVMDGNRNPNPSYEGEMRVIEAALKNAELAPDDIDYINPHGTGSIIGDETELKAIRDSRLFHAYINATKSITGHGLSAAGIVEIIATILQMQASRLHPTRNLEKPIDLSLNWVRNQPLTYVIKNAINISIGFGGINTALCLQRVDGNI